MAYVAVFWLCRVPPTQMLIFERTPPRRPYGRNFDLEIGLGSIVAYEVEYGPRMTTAARPSLGYVAVFWLCSERPTQMGFWKGPLHGALMGGILT